MSFLPAASRRRPSFLRRALGTLTLAGTFLLAGGASAYAAEPGPGGPQGPASPTGPTSVNVDLGGIVGRPSTSIVTILALTLLAVAPSLLLMTTSFTKVFVVLGLTRNALGVQNVPPNQVLAGLALFISLFIMAPTLSEVNERGVQPFLAGEKTQSQAFNDGVQPLREFMVDRTRKDELALFTKVAGEDKPTSAAEVPLSTLVPAFVLSELKSAFIIGFIIFIPFLVIDIVVSAALMSLGMMMLPPVMISLPFKLLLFVLVDGWGLVVTALVSSYT
ncbi:flagellar type III secretion system pore protein FliP [Motilibacter deserti]|nr:flagellar type III secretion system pore protein FliP [Motilibacter deserti]